MNNMRKFIYTFFNRLWSHCMNHGTKCLCLKSLKCITNGKFSLTTNFYVCEKNPATCIMVWHTAILLYKFYTCDILYTWYYQRCRQKERRKKERHLRQWILYMWYTIYMYTISVLPTLVRNNHLSDELTTSQIIHIKH